MIKLPIIPDKLLKEHYKKQEKPYKALLQALYEKKECAKITNYFFSNGQVDNNRLEMVLNGTPNQLKQVICDIEKDPSIIPESTSCKFIKLYDNFTNRIFGKTFCEKLGIKTCPYCNRSYIYTLEKGAVRPQYDHFYNKTKYPYLAVSIYNLIPSCGICNQAKSNYDTYNNDFLNPYLEEYGYDVRFETRFTGDITYAIGRNANFDLVINDSNAPNLQQKVRNTYNKLHIIDLYNKHKDYVRDIYKAKSIYTKEYIASLVEKFPSVFNSVLDVQHFAYMNYLDKEHWGERILSKLTYDIVNDLEE